MGIGTTVFAEDNDKEFKPIQVPSEAEFSKEDNGKMSQQGNPTERVYTNTTSEIEGNNSMGSADSISLTSGRSAAITSSSDVDWFSFKVPSNGNYRFDISDISSEADYDIELFSSQNESFGSSSGVLSFETIIASLPAGQTFYLRVYTYGQYSKQKYYAAVTTDANSQIVVVYMHMQSSASVSRDEWINADGHIGFTGNTGGSFGSHLHLQVNNNGKVFNSKTGGLSVTNNPLRYYPNINFKNTTPGDITERAVPIEPELKYSRELYSIKSELINFVGLSEFENFVSVMNNSEDQNKVYFTVMDFLNYFNISGEEFKTLVDQYDLSSLYDVDMVLANL